MSTDRPEQEPVTVTDKRRIDPDTFEVRDEVVEPEVLEPVADGAAESAAPSGEAAEPVSTEAAELAERTADLQRVTAEFANYRRRADAQRTAAAEEAKASIAAKFLDVLDDLDRARAHGDLESGPLKSLSDKLGGVFDSVGLVAFGAEGDAFDPELHEAVQMDGDGTHPVLGTVLRKGYRFGDRVLRHAMVMVTDGDPSDTPEQTQAGESGTE
ncbi:MAG: nucleotide exchange factor GrpE [Rhodococcus sp.]|uniref:nucleotide exchange factor GrpE n=1 Tax=Rhodococcus TaxID=1827 RepID=UPI0016B1A37D|nr:MULTISPECIES: nucleotide exchange factor GrpE [Rhodococcus]NLV80612.1 nucleotide exchange factor GrpE [Rhodococcus sp. (in: high G+C Gram-positive bacteria)]